MAKYSATQRASDVWQSSEKPQHISPDEFQLLSVCLFHPTPSTCRQTSRLWSSRSSQRHIRPKISLSLTVRDNASHQEHKWGEEEERGRIVDFPINPHYPELPVCLIGRICALLMCLCSVPIHLPYSSLISCLLSTILIYLPSELWVDSSWCFFVLSVTNLTYFVWSWQLCFIENEFWIYKKQPILSRQLGY